MIAKDRVNQRGEHRAVSVLWVGLVALLVAAPIPFGSNRPWSWSLAALIVSLLLMGWALCVMRGLLRPVWHRAFLVPLVLMSAVLIWILASIIPGVGPANPAWQVVSEQLGIPLSGQMALATEGVLVSLMRLLSYIAVFWLSLQFCRDAARAERLLVWISWLGLAMALYGLANFFSGNSYLLWYHRWASLEDVSATFVNRNHYATFAAIGLICASGLAFAAFRSAWRLSDRSQPTLPRTIECLSGRPIVYFVIAIVIAMALLQTHSRMGAAAGAFGVVVLLSLLLAAGMIRRGALVGGLAVLVGFLLFQTSGALTLRRLDTTSLEIDRVPLFAIVSEQIASAPYTGSGYGSFPQAFLMYRDLSLPFRGNYTTAHNSYLELAAEIGLPAAVAFIVAILWCAVLCLIGALRRRRDRLYPIVAIAATAVVGVHALTDFSIQIPAVALLYAAVLGMGLSQSWSTNNKT